MGVSQLTSTNPLTPFAKFRSIVAWSSNFSWRRRPPEAYTDSTGSPTTNRRTSTSWMPTSRTWVGKLLTRRALAVTRSPNSSARSASFTNATTGLCLSTCPTASVRPARSAAFSISRASWTDAASGFSTRTCTPASRSSSATSRCRFVGTATLTASTPAFTRSLTEGKNSHSARAATRFPTWASTSTTPASSAISEYTRAWFWPMLPTPTTPTRTTPRSSEPLIGFGPPSDSNESLIQSVAFAPDDGDGPRMPHAREPAHRDRRHDLVSGRALLLLLRRLPGEVRHPARLVRLEGADHPWRRARLRRPQCAACAYRCGSLSKVRLHPGEQK